MSVEAMVWALESAPDVPPQTLGVLMGLANHADAQGRGAYVGQERLAQYARKSDRQTRSDLARLEELGLIRRGDQSRVAYIRADKRPVVWDLAVERVREDSGRKCASGGNQSSGGKATSPRDESAGQETATGSTLPPGSQLPAGSTAQNDRKPTSDEPSEEPLEASLPTEEKNQDAREGDDNSGRRFDDKPPAPETDPAAKRKTKISASFTATPAMRAWATEKAPLVDVDLETEQFVDHWTGKGELRLDWVASWRTWMRNQQRWAQQRQPSNVRHLRPTGTDGRPTSGPRATGPITEEDIW